MKLLPPLSSVQRDCDSVRRWRVWGIRLKIRHRNHELEPLNSRLLCGAGGTGVVRDLYRVFEFINSRLALIISFIPLAMTLVVICSVLARYIFRVPWPWAPEITEYMLFFITVVPTAHVLLIEGHIKIDILVERLPKRVQNILSIITNGIGFVFASVLTWKSTVFTISAFQHNWYSMSSYLSVYLPPIVLWIPVSCFLLCMGFLAKIYRIAYLQEGETWDGR